LDEALTKDYTSDNNYIAMTDGAAGIALQDSLNRILAGVSDRPVVIKWAFADWDRDWR
jgi:hypothetical protein